MEFKKSFNQAVRRWFGELASGLGLHLVQLDEGVFEIEAPRFYLRIRGHSGHLPELGLLVNLVPIEKRFVKFGKEKAEIGVHIIMEYYGDSVPDAFLASSAEAVDAKVKWLAQLASRYCVPFLRGEAGDWKQIEEFLEQKIVDSGVRDMKFDLPKFVRKEWEVEIDND
jgi:hypothetical protein